MQQILTNLRRMQRKLMGLQPIQQTLTSLQPIRQTVTNLQQLPQKLTHLQQLPQKLTHLQPTRQTVTNLLTKDTLHCVCTVIVFAVASLFLFRATQRMLSPAHDPSAEKMIESITATSDSLAIGETLFSSSRDTLGKGDSMYSALRRKGLSGSQILDLIRALGRALDLGKVQVGDAYALTLNPSGDVERLEYHPKWDAGGVVIVERENDRLAVRHETAVLHTSVKAVHAKITTSLYSAILQQGGGAATLVQQFTDIFRWQVDFSKDVRYGDEIGLLVEEIRRGDLLAGYGRILAAEYRGRKDRYQAILYNYSDGRWGYYDPYGMSLRKMFLRSPLDYSRMTSGFSMSRLHPILNEYRPHWGVDYAASAGTPVKATADGVVAFRGWRNGMGNYVEINHGSGYATGYLHLSGFGPGIGRGSRVKQGQVIGYVGATGLATGPHVCYRFMKDGRHIDPLSAASPNAYPIAHRSAFFALRNERLRQLDEAMQQKETAPQMATK